MVEMTARPCLGCGDPSEDTRCPDCTTTEQRARPSREQRSNRWRRLSQRVRGRQRFCIDCQATEDLTADHIIPIIERPDLEYVEENVAVRCRRCNAAKRNSPPTFAERAEVEARIAARKRRRRTA